jgi:hypothetical protein
MHVNINIYLWCFKHIQYTYESKNLSGIDNVHLKRPFSMYNGV